MVSVTSQDLYLGTNEGSVGSYHSTNVAKCFAFGCDVRRIMLVREKFLSALPKGNNNLAIGQFEHLQSWLNVPGKTHYTTLYGRSLQFYHTCAVDL